MDSGAGGIPFSGCVALIGGYLAGVHGVRDIPLQCWPGLGQWCPVLPASVGGTRPLDDMLGGGGRLFLGLFLKLK